MDLLISQQMAGMALDDIPPEMRDSAHRGREYHPELFLNAINVSWGTHSTPVPGVAHDSAMGSILQVIASIFWQTGEYALIVDTTLKVGDIENVSGKVVMLPDPGRLKSSSESCRCSESWKKPIMWEWRISSLSPPQRC